MLSILITMVAIVVVAGLVVTFAAFPHRGAEVPGAAWLGATMNRAADAMPTLDDEHPHDAAEAEHSLWGASAEEPDSRA